MMRRGLEKRPANMDESEKGEAEGKFKKGSSWESSLM